MLYLHKISENDRPWQRYSFSCGYEENYHYCVSVCENCSFSLLSGENHIFYKIKCQCSQIGKYQIFYFLQDCSKCIDRYCENNLRQT